MHSKLSRRDFLKLSAGATGAALLAGSPLAYLGAQSDYQGKFVILSAGDAEQNAYRVEAIEAAFPGVEIDWRGLTSERYTELFAAAEIAGDQIDIMDLNGQDLRRYAVGGKLKDLSGLTYLDRFRPVGLETYTVQGKLWALPNGGISGFPFLTNQKILDQIGYEGDPETYDDLLDIKKELDVLGLPAFVHAGKNIYLWPIWQFWAYAQTSGNQSVERTFETLAGDRKFTDPDHVAALEILKKFSDDGMFIDSVNSEDSDSSWLVFSQGGAPFWYEHSWRIGLYREGDYPELDLSLIPPVNAVGDAEIRRQLPGGTGEADGIYANIAPEREEIALAILDLLSSDELTAEKNAINGDPVSTNINVEATEDPISLKYAEECSPNQTVYLDWYWPPEITRAFQEHQQAIVAGMESPEEAAAGIQEVLEDLYFDGYEFEM